MRTSFGALCLALVMAVPLGGSSASAQSETPARERLLSLTGEGVVRAQPDMALITLGIVSEAEAARDALSANTRSMSHIVETLKADGMESRDLQTSGFSVEPVYSQPPRDYDGSEPFEPKIVRYRVSNNLTLRVRALDRLGAILDEVVTLGANSISGPSFTVSDPTPLEDQARRAAMRDVLRKSALYADAADVTLGPITRIEEGYAAPPQPMAAGVMMRMEAADSKAVPIEGGELTFQAHVSVTWRLAD